jgi:hypothetical protein
MQSKHPSADPQAFLRAMAVKRAQQAAQGERVEQALWRGENPVASCSVQVPRSSLRW